MSDDLSDFIPAIWQDEVDRFFGNITYDESAPLVPTYCSECGHQTGEERPHSAACECLGCRTARMWRRAMGPPIPEGPHRISIPRFSDLKPGG